MGGFPQCKTSYAHVLNAPETGAPTIPDADPNRQLHSIWHGNTQDHPKGHKSNEHAVSLAPQLWTTAIILLLLATGKNKFCQLLDQASPSSPSQTNAKNFPHQTKNMCTQSTNKGGWWQQHVKIRHKKQCELDTTYHGQQNKKWHQPQPHPWAAARVCWNPKTPQSQLATARWGKKGLTPIRGQGQMIPNWEATRCFQQR